jgi:3-oxoacyl-[acyl-carrier protein] reductase
MGNTKSLAIITSASQGIGRATALRLARDFSAIVLVVRDKDNLETTATEIMSLGAEATASALDLRQPQSAKSIIEGTLERFGRIDALLNIAGAVPQIDLFQMTDAQWDDGMALKLNGARRLTIEAWDALKASNGSVVFMSGSAAFAPKPDMRQSRRSMQPLTRSPRHSQSKESKTACRSTAYRLERL